MGKRNTEHFSKGSDKPMPANQEKMLRDIETATPNVMWNTYIPNKQFGVVISLPHGCSITGTLTYDDSNSAAMYIDMFTVSGALQGKGLGAMLVRLLAKEAREYGATSISGNITSKSALGAMAKATGKNNLLFFNRATGAAIGTTYEEEMAKTENPNYIVRSPLLVPEGESKPNP